MMTQLVWLITDQLLSTGLMIPAAQTTIGNQQLECAQWLRTAVALSYVRLDTTFLMVQ